MEDIQLLTFGETLRTYRKTKKWTQRQLAERIGVHYNTVWAWERGDYLPETKGMVLELARQLGLEESETRSLLEASLTTLAPHWAVPFRRNPFFTGREEILETLHAQLGVEQAVGRAQSFALQGLGGVGKTQIALEYAYRHALEYSAILWIGAETDEQIASHLLHIADVLQLPGQDNKDQQRAIAAVQHWLNTHNQWLLIWDNIEDLARLDRFLPSTWSGSLLITTRRQALGKYAQSVDLPPMEQEEGMLFLLRRAKMFPPDTGNGKRQQLADLRPNQYTATAKLVTTLGGLPLALDQAGAYIEETGCSQDEYMQIYALKSAHLLDRRGNPVSDHPHSVVMTFRLSMERVERERPAAVDILRVCSLLHAEAIPLELFSEGAALLGPALAPLATDPIQFDLAIALLRNLSIVQRHAETRTLSIHRLAQAVIRERMGEQEQLEWSRRTVAALNAVIPAVTYETWKRCERFLPHILSCATLLPDEEKSLALAEVLRKAADCLRELVQYEQAEPLYRRALHIQEQVLGPDHPDLADSLNNLAILYREQGNYEQAEASFQQALHIQEQVLGSDHADLADSLNNLAILYREQGKYEQAEPLFQRAIHIWEQIGDPHLAHALNNLAIQYMQQGKYAEAEPLYEQALRIREQELGPEHPVVAQSLNNLAILHQNQGKYEQAEVLFQQALHIQEQAPGPRYHILAYVLNNLADLYMEQEKYEQVEPLYERARRLHEQLLGPEHINVTHQLNGLADLYTEQGKYEKAEALYEQALRIRENVLGPEHPLVATSLNGQAHLYLKQGKDEQSESLLQRARHIQEHYLGSDHSDTARTLQELATLRQKQGNAQEAISLSERALKILSQALGDTHPKTVAAHARLATLYQEQEKQA